MPDSSHFRYERKYEWPHLEPSQLEQKVALHPALFVRAFPTRKVFSLYFDTDDLFFLRQNVLGQSPRAKVRLRWYQQDGKHTTPNLEIKYKDGEVNTKHFFQLEWKTPFSLQDISTISSLNKISDMVRATLENQVQRASQLQPTLLNYYDRQYFYSQQTQIRLTIDSNLYFQQAVDYQQSFPARQLDMCVVEAKYTIENDSNLKQVIDHLPLRISKVSKYEHGMKATYPQV